MKNAAPIMPGRRSSGRNAPWARWPTVPKGKHETDDRT